MRILVVEDERDTATLVRMLLEQELEAAVDIASDCASARKLLSSNSYDLITMDYQLPNGDGLSLLQEIVERDGAPPVIMVTGHGDEQTAVSAFKLGASGYVVKGTRMSTLLIEEARSALARAGLKKSEEALRKSEKKYRLLYDNAGEAIFSHDSELILTDINRVGCEAIGYSREETLGKNVLELNIIHPRDLELAATVISRHFAGENVLKTEYTFIRKDGSERLFSVVSAAIRDPDGNLQSITNMCRDITDRKAAEEDVKRQREILQRVFDNIPVMVTYFDENGKIQMVSREVVEMLGWTFEEWNSGNILAKCYPEPEVFKEVLDFMVSGSTGWKDFKATTKHGTVIDTAWTNISLPDGVSMGIGQDITERKAAEEALRQSEERVRATLENLLSPDLDIGTLDLADFIDVQAVQSITDDFYNLTGIGVWILDLQGRILVGTGWQDICSKFHRVHPKTLQNCLESDTLISKGVEPGEFKLYRCKNNVWDIVTPIIVGGKHVGNLFLGQFFFEDEALDYEAFRLQAKKYGFDEQEYLDALERVPRWSREKVNSVMTFYAGFATMISTLGHSNIKLLQSLLERERALNSLRKSEELYRKLVEASPEAIAVVDFEGNVLKLSERAMEMFGYSEEDLSGVSMFDFVTEGYWDGVALNRETLIETGRVVGSEMAITRKDGSEVFVEVNASTIKDEDGNPSAIVAVVRDITERKAAEEALRLANEKLKGYAHTVSHDLKGPLSVVAAAAEMLSSILEGDDGEALEGNAGEVLRVIGDGTRRAVHMTENLLTLAQAGQAPAIHEPVDVSSIVRSVRLEKEALLKDRGVRANVDGDLGVAAMDPTHAYQLFANLIGNSIKYNDSENPEIHVSRLGEAEPGRLRYLVRDNGPGIPVGAEEDIFLPFHKGPDSTDTGIGLSIVDKVVRLYGGQIRAYNDGGACFEFTLPLYSS